MKKFIDYLNSINPLSEKTLALMSSVFKKDSLKAGEVFVEAGVQARDIAFLEKGVVRAYYTNKEGKEYNKTLFTAPAIIGSYVSLISGLKNELPQQALTNCIIWRARYDIIEELSEQSLELERLRRKIAERFFVSTEKKQLEMALMEAKERYALFKQEHPGVESSIPQYHIASYLGVTPTQLSRIRSDAKKS